PGRKIGIGEKLSFGDAGQLQGEVIERGKFGQRRIRFSSSEDFFALIQRFGHVPLPRTLIEKTIPKTANDIRPSMHAREAPSRPPRLVFTSPRKFLPAYGNAESKPPRLRCTSA